jgi:hypothetical protein
LWPMGLSSRCAADSRNRGRCIGWTVVLLPSLACNLYSSHRCRGLSSTLGQAASASATAQRPLAWTQPWQCPGGRAGRRRWRRRPWAPRARAWRLGRGGDRRRRRLLHVHRVFGSNSPYLPAARRPWQWHPWCPRPRSGAPAGPRQWQRRMRQLMNPRTRQSECHQEQRIWWPDEP